MTHQQAPAGVIPYVDHHAGERRLLTLHLTSGNWTGKNPPIVSVDGRQYIVYWGSVTFEVPGDRSVHVSVHIEAERIGQAASVLLPPGNSVALTYRTDFMSGQGSLH